jgi:methyltransferase (TIGR00027 family)
MQPTKSRSAEHVALFRALESARRDRVFDDPYAAGFLSGAYRGIAVLARIPAVGRRVERYIDAHYPAGPRGSSVARTRLIDDLVDDAVRDGARQVVILGAGYDSRAYRLPSAASAAVFEVDHPATQAAKRRLVESRVPLGRRAHVRFVPVDFERDDLAEALAAAGFATDRTAVVIWEGVTNYLTAEVVDATLRHLTGLAAPGSRLVFTYVDRGALDGSGEFGGLEEWVAVLRRGGEPWRFGLVPGELPGYLAERGLRLEADLSTRDAADRYLAPLGRDDVAAPFYRIALAEVL